MDEKDRGRLFLPYAALVGFDELVAKQTQVTERRRERSDEENELLSRQVLSLHRGMQVRVTWYEDGFYRTCTGTVQRVAVAERTLTLDKRTLSFDDLYAVEEMDGDTQSERGKRRRAPFAAKKAEAAGEPPAASFCGKR